MAGIGDGLVKAAKQDGINRFSVGAIIISSGKILVLKRKPDDFLPNIFELPGGGIEGAESVLAALKREVLEETGFTVSKVLGYCSSFDYASEDGAKTRQFNFLIKTNDNTPKLSEHSDYRWISKDDLAGTEISAEVKKIINSAFRQIRKVRQ